MPLVLAELSALIKSLPAVFVWFQTNYGPSFLENFGFDPFGIKPEQVGIKVLENWAEAGGVLGNIVSRITDSAFTFFSATGNFFLSLIVAFYFMIDFDAIVEKIHKLIPRRYEATAAKLGKECDEILGAFLRGQMWVMFLMGCVYSLGLYVLGIDQALLIGFLAGLLQSYHILALPLGFLGAAIAALLQFGDLFFLVYVALVFLAAQFIETVLLTPWLVGDRIGLHPLAVIFSLMVGGYLFGFAGILLALPFSAVAMVLLRHWHQVYISSPSLLEKKRRRRLSKDFFHQLPLFLDYSAQVEDEFNEFVENQADRILLNRGLTLVCGLRSSAKNSIYKSSTQGSWTQGTNDLFHRDRYLS